MRRGLRAGLRVAGRGRAEMGQRTSYVSDSVAFDPAWQAVCERLAEIAAPPDCSRADLTVEERVLPQLLQTTKQGWSSLV